MNVESTLKTALIRKFYEVLDILDAAPQLDVDVPGFTHQRLDEGPMTINDTVYYVLNLLEDE